MYFLSIENFFVSKPILSQIKFSILAEKLFFIS